MKTVISYVKLEVIIIHLEEDIVQLLKTKSLYNAIQGI